MKSDYLTNPLQKELFAKVVDLLLDQPRRLTYRDAEVALAEAWNKVFHRGLSEYVMTAVTDLENRHEILATGISPVHAVLAYCKKDDNIHSYNIDEKSQLHDKNGFWYLDFSFNADRFTAKLIETRGGFVMISYEHRQSKSTKKEWYEAIRKAIVNLMIENGWSKSVCVDVLSTVDLENSGWTTLAEVHHDKRKKVVVEGQYLPNGSVIITNWRYGGNE